ncbi:MAG: hypothetical protein ACRDJO_00885, partial [Actinomycetota bacterium]
TFPGGPGVEQAARIQFYVPTTVEILPAFLHGGHGTSAHLWLGDAGLAPVSGALADPARSPR